MNSCNFNKDKKCQNCTLVKGDTPFRKTVIPAVLGTDEEGQPHAPANGQYQNMLVEYEANGAVYIYSSDGIFTKLPVLRGGEDITKLSQLLNDMGFINAEDAEAIALQIAGEQIAGANIPRKTSDLENDSTFVTNSEAETIAQSAAEAAAGAVEVPTLVSQLANDAGYLTASQISGSTSGAVLEANAYTDLKIGELSPVAASGSFYDLSDVPTAMVIEMTTSDPGEGASLEFGHFIGVYNG